MSADSSDNRPVADSKLVLEFYKDALQPATREVGAILARAVRTTLAPVRGLAWTWEKAEAWVEEAATQRLSARSTLEDRLVTPPPQLMAQIVRGVQASGPDPDPTLREMFAGLLAAAIDADNSANVHPAFAEILSQLAPGEARLLHAVSRKEGPLLAGVLINEVTGVIPMQEETIRHVDVMALELTIGSEIHRNLYLENLSRLGLISRRSESYEVWSNRPLPGEPFKANQEHVARWHQFREYLDSYGIAEVRSVLEDFERRASLPEFKNATPTFAVNLGRRRPQLQLLLVWVSALGKQLLRACVDAVASAPGTGNRLDELDE